MTSKSIKLSKSLGGKWTYNPATYSWYCDDGIRSVCRVSAGVDEFDNPLGPTQYWLYGDGSPRRAEQYFRTSNSISVFDFICKTK